MTESLSDEPSRLVDLEVVSRRRSFITGPRGTDRETVALRATGIPASGTGSSRLIAFTRRRRDHSGVTRCGRRARPTRITWVQMAFRKLGSLEATPEGVRSVQVVPPRVPK
jgi:hypothetical protein